MSYKTWDLVACSVSSYGVFSEELGGSIGLGDNAAEALSRYSEVALHGVDDSFWYITEVRYLVLPGCLL